MEEQNSRNLQIKNLRPGEYCFYCLRPTLRKMIRPERILYQCLHCGKIDGLRIKIDPNLKSSWKKDELVHYTMGAILKNEKTGKFLLMKKRTYPLVIDVVAGHIKVNETPEQTLRREVKEETGIEVEKSKLLWEGLIENDRCRHGAPHHYWYIFYCPFHGQPSVQYQEVNFFKEYTWEELVNEEMLNPAIKDIVAGLSTALLTV